MNNVQKELQADFDLYWAELSNIAPLTTKDEGIREVAESAFIHGAMARQRITERELDI